MCSFGFWLILVLCVLFSGMSGYLHTTTQRAKSRLCMVSSLNVTWISGVPHMFIFVRSLFPNVGWHDRVSYADDYSKRVLGSDQHCCREPTYYEPCKREKNVFLLQPAARVSFRSCCGGVLLDGSFWPCGLCLLLRVGSASGFPEACPQVLSPSATTRQAPWKGKKCAYLWRRATPRARPRDVGSWQQKASVNHGFVMGCFDRTRRRLFLDVTPRALPVRSLHRPATDIFRKATQNR